MHPGDDGRNGEEAAYYDVSLLKKPVWKWEIAAYFFLGGLSSGAYLLARVADRAGGERHRPVTRAGTWVSLATVIPCPPLLIADLGDPKRFHHMLRVIKPSSPMNLGTWTLVGYSGMVAAAAAREWMRERDTATGEQAGPEDLPGTAGRVVRVWLTAHDAAGIPMALIVASYTGVLLSCTANPLWCKNPWLAPLFSASAISTGAEAINLVLNCTTRNSPRLEASRQLVQRIDTAAHAAEAVAQVGFSRSAGEKARPLRQGSISKLHKFALGALVVSEVLKLVPASPRYRKPLRILSAATGLAAGVAMRWALVQGGREAADDPHLARVSSRVCPENADPAERSHPVSTAPGESS